jgi:hypothetical protein
MNKKIAVVIILSALFLSNSLLYIYVLNEKNHYSISFFIITWIVAIVLLIPIFMMISLLLICLIGLVISLINKDYLFKRLYLTVAVFNSLQLLMNIFLIVLSPKEKISTPFIFSWNFLLNVGGIFFFEKY